MKYIKKSSLQKSLNKKGRDEKPRIGITPGA
jgi:hypothetical protein